MLKMTILVIFGPQDSLGFWPLEAARVKNPEVCKNVHVGETIFTFFRALLANVSLNNLAKRKKKLKKQQLIEVIFFLMF